MPAVMEDVKTGVSISDEPSSVSDNGFSAMVVRFPENILTALA
jgi:hypothetical protein